MGRLGFGKFWISFVKGFPAKCNLHLAGKPLTNEIQIPIFPTLMASKIMIKNSNHFKISAEARSMCIFPETEVCSASKRLGAAGARFASKVCGFTDIFGELLTCRIWGSSNNTRDGFEWNFIIFLTFYVLKQDPSHSQISFWERCSAAAWLGDVQLGDGELQLQSDLSRPSVGTTVTEKCYK